VEWRIAQIAGSGSSGESSSSDLSAIRAVVESILAASDQVESLLSQTGGGIVDVEAILSQISIDLAALKAASTGSRPIVSTSRDIFECSNHGISAGTLIVVPPRSNRVRLRINNNSGDGSQGLPIINPCDLVVGYEETPTETAWDQIVTPGQSVLVDAPHLEIKIGCLSAGTPLEGLIGVTQYFV
jgi:hypothetical protein